MKYAKLEDGVLRFAPKVLRVDGKTMINPNGETLKQYGYLPIAEDIMPMAMEGYEVQSAGYAVEDGQIVHKWEQVEKPIPTQEDISRMRQTAYEAECDSLLVAWMGYTAEGDTAKAESARKAYLRAKAEVRKRLPYAEESSVQIPIAGDDDLL